MNGQRLWIALCAFVILFLTLPARAMAAEQDDNTAGGEKRVGFSFGYRQYYLWWDPVWKRSDDNKTSTSPLPIAGKQTWHGMHDFAYNPFVAVRWSNWSMSGSFSYAHYKNDFDFTPWGPIIPGQQILFFIKKKTTIDKYDADLLFSVKIKPWCSIFFGPKYYGYQMTTSGDLLVFSSTDPTIFIPKAYNNNPSFHSGGLGIGTGFNVPLVGNFTFQANAALLCFAGWDSYKTYYTGKNKIAWSIGAIGDIHFAYYIPAAHLYLAAGGRVQYQYFIQKVSAAYLGDGDLYYGPSFTVMFVF